MRAKVSIFGLTATCLAGCGSSSSVCTEGVATLSVTPQSAVADHANFPPGNRQQFVAISSPAAVGPGCATPAFATILKPDWSTSDPLHISISSAADSTNGLAVCLGPTAGPATVTAHIVQSSPSGASTTTLISATLYCE